MSASKSTDPGDNPATNEGLSTVNDEKQSRIVATNQLNNDLVNLIDCVNIPIVMLSRDLHIRRFSPAAQRVLKVIPSDIGRHISDIKPRISVPDWEPLILEVLDTLTPQQREVRDQDGHWYAMTIRPYKTLDQKIDGAVIALTDIDALKRTEFRIKEAR